VAGLAEAGRGPLFFIFIVDGDGGGETKRALKRFFSSAHQSAAQKLGGQKSSVESERAGKGRRANILLPTAATTTNLIYSMLRNTEVDCRRPSIVSPFRYKANNGRVGWLAVQRKLSSVWLAPSSSPPPPGQPADLFLYLFRISLLLSTKS
jgi:hypothetical protein